MPGVKRVGGRMSMRVYVIAILSAIFVLEVISFISDLDITLGVVVAGLLQIIFWKVK